MKCGESKLIIQSGLQYMDYPAIEATCGFITWKSNQLTSAESVLTKSDVT
jgi:hypothetical protein